MMWLKSCPRCQGDLYAGNDSFGAYIACAQCGNTLNAVQEQALKLRTIAKPAHSHTGAAHGARRVAAGAR